MHRFTRTTLALSALVATLLLPLGLDPVAAAGPAAPPASASGWVAVRSPGLASYVPADVDQWVLGPEGASVLRTGVGRHRVTLDEIGHLGGIAHVAPLGTAGRFCSLVLWDRVGIDVIADVRCYDAGGVDRDTPFLVSWFWANGLVGSSIGSVWADRPGTASYTPTHDYTFNSDGGANSIQRLATGDYRVTFGGLDAPNGIGVVSAYGTANRVCRVHGWTAVSAGERVRVKCQTLSGTPADARFTLTWAIGDTIDHLSYGAYLRASGTVADERVDDDASTYRKETGAIHVIREATGRYRITFANMPRGGVAYVSGLGAQALRCRITSIRTTGTPATVKVACRTLAGAYANGPFGFALLTTPPTG